MHQGGDGGQDGADGGEELAGRPPDDVDGGGEEGVEVVDDGGCGGGHGDGHCGGHCGPEWDRALYCGVLWCAVLYTKCMCVRREREGGREGERGRERGSSSECCGFHGGCGVLGVWFVRTRKKERMDE